jgi:hypothetical protein
LFLTPANNGPLVWGAGPTLSFPTATVTGAETGTWALGVSGVVVHSSSRFVFGALVSQLWPMADAGGDPETNLFTTQPFVNDNFGRGWALGLGP